MKNDPRRLATHFGKISVQLIAQVVLSVFVVCAIVRLTGADAWIAVAFLLASMAGLFSLALRMTMRSPLVVVKVTAEGANHATWLLIASFVPLALAAALLRDPLLIPPVVLTAITTLLLWRGRGRVPEVLRKFRPLLAPDESVLGDGLGLARGARGWQNAFRLVVATDRRVLVATSTRSSERFLLVDVPYRRVSRFGIEWKYWGRLGVLSLTVVDGAPSDTHVITSIAPANLLSIVHALQSHGVHADDPAAVFEAESAWEEALRRGGPRKLLPDRAAMNTPEFDRGLWLFLGLSAVTFYVNPFGVGFGASRDVVVAVLLVVPALSAICGYVSRTKWSLVYVGPLNLVVSPAFFFADASDVISVMLVLSSVAAVGLWAGAALRGATAKAMASSERRPARGSLRHAISGLGLIRITGVLLVTMLGLVATATAAGFELTSLSLALDEATLEQVPVDGRSNLTGNAASLSYTPGPDLHEFITDEHLNRGPNDGARWELRSSWIKGFNVVSLAHYVFEPRLDDAAAVAAFLARKDREHSRLAGYRVTHTERVVGRRKGYVWNHGSRRGDWYYAAWFPQPAHSVRVECIARRQVVRFNGLCAEAVRSLKFH